MRYSFAQLSVHLGTQPRMVTFVCKPPIGLTELYRYGSAYVNSSYSSWDEIFAYFKGIADKYELYKYIRLKHKVSGARWDEQSGMWKVNILNQETGDVIHDEGHILINGTGVLK